MRCLLARRGCLAFALFALVATFASYAEPAGESANDDFFGDDVFDDDDFDDDFFSDPFSVEEEEPAQADEPDDPFGFDEFDSLFLDADMIDTADESLMSESPQDDFLRFDGVRWGGRIRGSLRSDWAWDDVWTPDFALTEPDSNALTPSIGADLFFDARPRPDFRAYGKLRIQTTTPGGAGGTGLTADALIGADLPGGITAEEDEQGNIVIRDGEGTEIFRIPAVDPQTGAPATGTPPGLELTVFELFSDYTWRDTLFFRFGRHTIKWGTGYFFSPADVLNLTAIDAEDPTAERLGPLSLRTVRPFGLTGNAYLYLITNASAGLLDVAVAPRIDFAVGRGEVGLGAYYQRALAPRLIALATASVGEVDLFAEGVLLWGSDRVFVAPASGEGEDLELRTYEVDDRAFVQSTVGARYLKEWDNGVSAAVIGQYFYNGEGYDGSVPGLLPAAARLLLNPARNADAPRLGFSDLANWGRHYAAATVTLSGLLLEGLSVSALGLANLSDRSGVIIPGIRYQFLERFSLGLSARFTFGPEDGEYTDPSALFFGRTATPTFGLTLDLSMPGGAF